ncbi:MAG: hypothetical protein U0797_00980 [Gemmataceae bacterium]
MFAYPHLIGPPDPSVVICRSAFLFGAAINRRRGGAAFEARARALEAAAEGAPVHCDCTCPAAFTREATYLAWATADAASQRACGRRDDLTVFRCHEQAKEEALQSRIRGDLTIPAGLLDPGRLPPLTAEACQLARVIDAEQLYTLMPILGDALYESGVDAELILTHCRAGGPHFPGCWVLEVVRHRCAYRDSP